mmetsp:Transcript_25055/g.63045  ORF Transcript_25055/g.63045 Transcript_25055/m.63045 type:complete len:152 (-) Transcript_25055:199-654(-)|eukprot:CAMPEP_0113874556 /NCGR_PEP_ID=MMETSP0780_2-20120614/4404_1 /TAXON_ID=652834 /ORGANISM="Palpitomonas bilix" /LENGTH=151 /DNA_ID=CAMNT_0000860351 /DNA_START=28 /DNA_END=483 /DNA_ORIENTATION=+ /assembly_acc=CAM_ASM_000599
MSTLRNGILALRTATSSVYSRSVRSFCAPAAQTSGVEASEQAAEAKVEFSRESWSVPADHVVKITTREYINPTTVEPHPAQKKVVLELNVRALNLEESVENVMKELVGKRYNEKTGVLKLVCDHLYEQDKAADFLRGQLEQVLLESKKLAA